MLKLSLDKDYKAAIYLRLSKEDGDFSISGEKLESDSISNRNAATLFLVCSSCNIFNF